MLVKTTGGIGMSQINQICFLKKYKVCVDILSLNWFGWNLGKSLARIMG